MGITVEVLGEVQRKRCCMRQGFPIKGIGGRQAVAGHLTMDADAVGDNGGAVALHLRVAVVVGSYINIIVQARIRVYTIYKPARSIHLTIGQVVCLSREGGRKRDFLEEAGAQLHAPGFRVGFSVGVCIIVESRIGSVVHEESSSFLAVDVYDETIVCYPVKDERV